MNPLETMLQAKRERAERAAEAREAEQRRREEAQLPVNRAAAIREREQHISHDRYVAQARAAQSALNQQNVSHQAELARFKNFRQELEQAAAAACNARDEALGRCDLEEALAQHVRASYLSDLVRPLNRVVGRQLDRPILVRAGAV